MVPNGYTLERPGPYCLTHHFLIFDIRSLWRSGLSAREPECQKLKNGGLYQYGPERFGRLILLQSEKCGTERVNQRRSVANNVGCFRRDLFVCVCVGLFVCLFVNMITSERVNIG